MPNGVKTEQGRNDEKAQNDRKFVWKASHAIALGSNLAVGMALFTFIGYYVDRKRGGGIFWTMCGMGLGFVYGAYEVWKVIKMLSAGNDRGEEKKAG
jgi:F0F1-type ATP synthase assembly protein I